MRDSGEIIKWKVMASYTTKAEKWPTKVTGKKENSAGLERCITMNLHYKRPALRFITKTYQR